MNQPASYRPKEGLPTAVAVAVLLGGLLVLVVLAGTAAYLLPKVFQQRASSADARESAGLQPWWRWWTDGGASPQSKQTTPPGAQTGDGQPANGGRPEPVKTVEIQMGVRSENGDFSARSSFPASIEQITCRVTLPSVTTGDVYSTYWYVDDVPGDRTGRLMGVVHCDPFTEEEARLAQRRGWAGFDNTMRLSGRRISPGLYKVEVVKNGQKLRFVRFRIE